MAVAAGLVCCLLLAQPQQNTSPAPPLREEAAGPLVPVRPLNPQAEQKPAQPPEQPSRQPSRPAPEQPPEQKLTQTPGQEATQSPKQTPEQIIVDALTPPDEQPLPGRPVSLLDALARTVGRARQLDMIRSYWRVATATAAYNFRRDEFAQIQALTARATAEGSQPEAQLANRLLLEQASASARLRDAELRAIAAQTELAERFGVPPGEPLPLASDIPLTGPYLTKLKELFAGRIPPPRLQLIDQLIPLRYEAVAARAQSLQAASDALQAVKDQYQRREVEGDRVAPRIIDLAEQRQAFLTSVLEYNSDIAEYALATAPETATPAALLPTLIKVRPSSPSPPAAPPRDTPPTAIPTQPPPASGREQARADNGELRSVLVKPGQSLDEKQETRLRVPPGESSQSTDNEADSEADQDLDSGLLELEPPKRTHRLAKLLHQDRNGAQKLGTPTSLSACLALAAPAQRERVLAAYWRTRQLAALRHALAVRRDQLVELEPVVLNSSAGLGGAEAMLLLRSRQIDADADLLEITASFLTSQYELSSLVGRSTSPDQLLLPTTPPHGGRYQLRTDVQPRTIAEAHRIAQLSDAVPDLHALLEDRSEAVTRANHQRDLLIDEYRQGSRSLDDVLSSIARHEDETQRFLKTLTRYNEAIADYVLAVTPVTVPVPQLAAAMVVNPTR